MIRGLFKRTKKVEPKQPAQKKPAGERRLTAKGWHQLKKKKLGKSP